MASAYDRSRWGNETQSRVAVCCGSCGGSGNVHNGYEYGNRPRADSNGYVRTHTCPSCGGSGVSHYAHSGMYGPS